MPNSAACLIELMVSPPALASPMICAFEACACSRKEEKSVVLIGCAHLADHLAAGLGDDRGDVALQRVAEGIVGGEEEPALAARLDHRRAGAVGQRRGVVDPVHGVGIAELAGDVGRGRIGREEDPLLLAGDALDGDRRRRGAGAQDHVDLLGVVPAAGERGGDVGLVLDVAGDQLDLLAERRCRRNRRSPSARRSRRPVR